MLSNLRSAHLLQSWLSRYASELSKADYALVLTKSSEIASAPPPEAGEIGLVAGIPLETYKRQARIYVPSRTASQQGLSKTHENTAAPAWKLEFPVTAKWINPLIGWTSTADPLESVARASLSFYTKEEAIAFAAKHGWEYSVDEPHIRNPSRQKRFFGYGDNFSVKRKGVPDLSTLKSNWVKPPSGEDLAKATRGR